jgi:hypothetical protein
MESIISQLFKIRRLPIGALRRKDLLMKIDTKKISLDQGGIILTITAGATGIFCPPIKTLEVLS